VIGARRGRLQPGCFERSSSRAAGAAVAAQPPMIVVTVGSCDAGL